MGLTTRSCRLGGTTSARMKRWRLSGSTVGCVIGFPAFADGPALGRKRSTWSTPPSHCLPPTTSIEQRQNSPCHCLLNTLNELVVPGTRPGVRDRLGGTTHPLGSDPGLRLSDQPDPDR